MAIKGIMFDLDGTLVDSTWFWNSSGEFFVRSKGLEPKENLDEDLIPLDAPQTAAYLKEHYDLPGTVEDILRENCKIVSEKYNNEFELKPGVKNFLKNMKNKNIKMCIVTLTEKEFVLSALNRFGIEDFFCDVITTSETGLTKEEPEIFDYAVGKMGISKEETVLFEDSLYSIMSAKSGNYQTVGVYDEMSKEKWERVKTVSDYHINDFYDVNKISFLFED